MNQDTDSHPSGARLVACLDGELGDEERDRLSRHVEGCRSCRGRLEELRESARTFSEAVSGLRPPPSDAGADELRRRAAVREEETEVAGRVEPDRDDASDGFRWSTVTRMAASIAVLLGVAAALPGSPVRSWIDRSVEGVQALLDGEDAPVAEAERPAAPRPEITDRSGVAVGASRGSIRVTLVEVPASTTIRVRLVDGPQAGVWNAGGRYQTAPGRIRVTAPASETLLVEIPRSVSRVRLEVNGELVAASREGALDVRISGAEPRDGEFTFRPAGTR